MKIKEIYQLFIECGKVTTDSRIVEKNAIFFALQGENFNGNQYAYKAIENGCAYAIVDDKNFVKDNRFIYVDNVLNLLQELGSYHRNKLGVPIIAITGTNGKTTTKELIASVLAKKYTVTFTKGNLNNHIGVPLTLLSMNSTTDIGVVEMGANHMGEIKQLCEIAEPNYGIITNIGKAHLEGFGSLENIIKTKSELYDFIGQSNGKVFYNSLNPILKEEVEKRNLDTIQFAGINSNVKGKIIPKNEFLSLRAEIEDEQHEVYSNLVGNYNLENILAAIAIGNYFKVKTIDIISAIEKYVPKNNRSQFVKTEKNNIYLDAYNANPSSVELSVKNFNSLAKKNSLIILGDMLELGEDSNKEHLAIVHLLKSLNCKKVILVGKVFSSVEVPKEYLQFENANDLKEWMLENKIEQSNVLIKASRGIQLETIVEYL